MSNKTPDEIIANQAQRIKKLESDKRELQAHIRKLTEQLNKWTKQQGKGKRIGWQGKKVMEHQNDIEKWEKDGLSNRKIAELLGVSEGTVRKYAKKNNHVM